MARDFLSDQIRTKNLIGSGSSPNPKLVVYSDTDAPDNAGTLPANLLDNVGSDVFLFVSGTINGKADDVNKSTTLFGGDVVVSGTLYAEKQIIEVDVNQTGSLLVSGSITHEDGINIGQAEDGTYADGLFTDFTSSTMLGVAVDRFNEVLKALAPAPAPTLDQLDIDSATGQNAFLSFGPSNNLNNTSPAYITVSNKAGLTAKDVNDEYTSNDNRLGVFNTFAVKSGTLNEDVSNDTYTNNVINYPDNSFGEADIDTLCLVHNGVKTLHTTDLSSFGSGQSFNANNSGFTLSAATPGVFSSGTTFPTFKYRTGTWQIGVQDQINGMNYIQISKRRYGNTVSFTEMVQNKVYEIVAVNGTDFSVIASSVFSDSEYFPNSWNFSTNVPDVVGLKFTRNNVVIENNNVVGTGTVREIISESNTGFAEWVNDNNTDSLSIASKSLTLNLTGTKHLSGVNYFTGGNSVYTADIDNFYKYVYGVSPVTFSAVSVPSGVSFTLPDFTPPTINTGGGENHTKTLSITSTGASFALPSNNRIITDNNSGITINALITHPYKTLTQTLLNESENGILIDNASQSSTVINEYFDDESFRMITKTSPSYNLQSDVTDSANHWVSTETITTGNTGYSDGLLVHNGKLQSTKNDDLVNNGNFSTLNNGPASNPDYSNGNIAAGTKKYIRRFTNNTGNSVRDIRYEIQGLGDIRNHSFTLGSDNNNFKLYFKLPGDTAWLDAASDFSYNNVSADGNGGKIGSFTQNISSSPTNYLTFGTAEVSNNENILIKIESNKTWKGSIDDILLTFGAVGSVLPSPDVSQIDVNDTGVAGKLSFGTSLAKTGYNNVLSIGGSTAIDVNNSYNVSSFSNNTRRGIFDGNQLIDGEINENVSASGNSYPNNAWGSGQANIGELKLELNGTILTDCTIDLTTFGSGNSLNSNNSGFKNITSASVGQDSNNLPDYRYFYRTGSFEIQSSDQRDGWNYLRVLHDLDGGTTIHEANYAEWVNNSTNTIAVQANSNIELDVYNSITSGSTPPNYLSGISYFTSAIGEFAQNVTSAYKYVYSTSNSALSYPVTQNITVDSIEVSGVGVVNDTINSNSRGLPNLDTSVATAAEEDILVTANYSYSALSSLPGNLTSASIRISVLHPLTSNSGSTISLTKPLIYTINDTETALVENFSAESYRLQNGAYTNQSDINSGTWDSQQSLIGANSSHNDGLQVYNNSLVYPAQDFSDNFILKFKGPINNPDYSSASGDRVFYREFENTTTSSKFGFQIKIKGNNSTIVSNTTTPLTGNNIHVFVKLPNTSNAQTTGFMDLALPFNTDQTGDNDGCLQGSLSPTIINTGDGTSNNITFGTVFASPGDSVVVKIVAGSTWSGDINRIEVVWS